MNIIGPLFYIIKFLYSMCTLILLEALVAVLFYALCAFVTYSLLNIGILE